MTFIETLPQLILDITWFNPDTMSTLLIKFAFNITMVFLIVKVIYSANNDKRDHIFTYFIFNILIFFLCHLMINVELGMGFAFGLFALFSIMRYRTQTISIKDMTYLFSVVCIAVMNAMNNEALSIFELVFINLCIVAAIFILERSFFKENIIARKVAYEKVSLVQPQHYEELKADLEMRMGLTIKKVEVYSVNYLNDSAVLYVHYNADEYANQLGTKVDLDEMDRAKFNGTTESKLEEAII